MTEIAQTAGVAIGSLYQYFSDKGSIMRALLERHNAEVDRMMVADLAGVSSLNEFVDALEQTYTTYFEQHQRDPLFQSIWSAVQTDADLQAMDVQDTLSKARYLHALALPLYRKVDSDALLTTCAVILQLALSAARFALALPEPLRSNSLTIYQGMTRAALLGLEGE